METLDQLPPWEMAERRRERGLQCESLPSTSVGPRAWTGYHVRDALRSCMGAHWTNGTRAPLVALLQLIASLEEVTAASIKLLRMRLNI